ncbi:MAG: tetratricopeptide repeat protein [Spirochaetales bacterium]|nr:tetratricopeptide repeat protein [Spirochaetales bacterium]
MIRVQIAMLAILLSLPLLGCSSPRDYFIEVPGADSRQLSDLFTLLDSGTLGVEERYAVIQKISTSLANAEDYPRLVDFLSGVVADDPEGPYNARYLLSIAWAYARQGADEVAALYYDRIVKNYPDLSVGGESIHVACLRRLIRLVDDPARRIEFRRELISRFPDTVDMGTELFLLGNDYESLGDWDAALDAYRRFLPAFANDVPGHPDALQYARLFIDLATIRKDWTYETLDELLNAISVAMATGNHRAISRIRAKVGFFAMDWYQDKDDGNSQVLFDFAAFMSGSRIQRAPSLDPSSNSREAFLRTWGWTERISVWYLYFRKVDFPADPEVHGRWEWAGIYFGEKMQ